MISLLFQADTTQVAASASTESGTLFWLVVGVVGLTAFLAYWRLKPSAATPPTPIKRTTAYPEDRVAQAVAQAQAVAAETARQQKTAGTQKNEPSTTQRTSAATKSAAPVESATSPVKPVIEPTVTLTTSATTVAPKSENESPRAKAVDPLAELEKRLGVKAREARTVLKNEKPTARGSGSAEQQTPGNGRSGVGKEVVVMPLAEEKLPSTVKHIGYQPPAIPETGQFPRVRMPKAGCVIKFPRVGRSGHRGYKEADFMLLASSMLRSEAVKVYNDRHVPTPNALSPYEPDLVLVNELNGLNLFLDIEIDEPYDGVSWRPSHCKGDDERDEFFTRRGWVVVRFAEIQIHQQPEACCAYIAQLIRQLDPTYQIPTALVGKVLQPVAYWDTVQAQKWAKQKYREGYLGIPDFGRRETQAQWSQAEASDLEKEVEQQVAKTAGQLPRPADGQLAGKNPHPRDKHLSFDPDKHQYLIDGQPATAVSTLVDRFFPEFDSEYWGAYKARQRGVATEVVLKEWADKGKDSAALGTRLHEHIETFYNSGATATHLPEFKQFLNFHGDHGHLTPHRTEWRVFNEDVLVAGTLDFVAQHPDGSVSIYDWKRSEKVIHADGRIQQNGYQTKEGPLGDLDDSRFSRYSIQQNLYKWLLESKYGCRVRSMHLVVLHPAYNSYTVLDVPDRAKHVQRIVESLHSNV
jgi:hypothetical protein